ncbi:TBC1 domain family member 22A [Pteropus alecto]|uniref:TBC1 domain family member 22A n=1 Tax=Pteropus alecto TaxID=9402 RepID=L5KAL1_PTEAL|nr:TBC1 domain family member 22A [Pteropus alecto]
MPLPVFLSEFTDSSHKVSRPPGSDPVTGPRIVSTVGHAHQWAWSPFCVAVLSARCLCAGQAAASRTHVRADNYTFAQPGIQMKVRMLEELVSRIDEHVHRHLEQHEVRYLQFAFRWMNNLLTRELPPRCAVRLWDTYQVEITALAVLRCAFVQLGGSSKPPVGLPSNAEGHLPASPLCCSLVCASVCPASRFAWCFEHLFGCLDETWLVLRARRRKTDENCPLP